MSDQTPGQIAFAAHQSWQGFERTWRELSLADQAMWDHIGQAVAQAVAPMPGISDE